MDTPVKPWHGEERGAHQWLWDGGQLTLTPAYDICPQNRAGNETSQAMLIIGESRMSRLATCIEAAPNFLLDPSAAQHLITDQIDARRLSWPEVAEEAKLNEVERDMLVGRAFLNPFISEGAPDRLRTMRGELSVG